MTRQTQQSPLFSVVVCVYNVDKYVVDCLKSLHDQEFDDVEFIVVDDGSTDDSGNICDKYAALDRRFKILHQDNQGTLLARTRGVLQAKGQYILFLDGDDIFASDSFIKMKDLVKTYDEDIIQFSCGTIGKTNILKKKYIQVAYVNKEKKCSFCDMLDYATEVFVKENYNWVCWNKIFKADIIKRACLMSGEHRCITAEDAYIHFICCTIATSFRSVNTDIIYLYRLNSGITTKKTNISIYHHHLVREIRICKWLEKYLEEEHILETWRGCLEGFKKTLTKNAARSMSMLTGNGLHEAIPEFFEFHDVAYALPFLMRAFSKKEGRFAEGLKNSLLWKHWQQKTCNKRALGIIFPQTDSPDAKQDLHEQLWNFAKMGYPIVLFAERLSEKETEAFPPNIVYRPLPTNDEIGSKKTRIDVLYRTIHEQEIRMLLDYSSSSPNLPFNLLLARFLGVQTVVRSHERKAFLFSLPGKYPFRIDDVYPLADCVLTNSNKIDRHFRKLGINSVLLPNICENFSGCGLIQTLVLKIQNTLTMKKTAKLRDLIPFWNLILDGKYEQLQARQN